MVDTKRRGCYVMILGYIAILIGTISISTAFYVLYTIHLLIDTCNSGNHILCVDVIYHGV